VIISFIFSDPFFIFVWFTVTIHILNSNFTWKHVGDSAGNHVGGTGKPINLPNAININEILVIVRPNASNDYSDQMYTIYIPYVYLEVGEKIFCAGHVYPVYEPNRGSVAIRASRTSIIVDWASAGNSDTTNNYYMSVYVR